MTVCYIKRMYIYIRASPSLRRLPHPPPPPYKQQVAPLLRRRQASSRFPRGSLEMRNAVDSTLYWFLKNCKLRKVIISVSAPLSLSFSLMVRIFVRHAIISSHSLAYPLSSSSKFSLFATCCSQVTFPNFLIYCVEKDLTLGDAILNSHSSILITIVT